MWSRQNLWVQFLVQSNVSDGKNTTYNRWDAFGRAVTVASAPCQKLAGPASFGASMLCGHGRSFAAAAAVMAGRPMAIPAGSRQEGLCVARAEAEAQAEAEAEAKYIWSRPKLLQWLGVHST